MKTILLSICLLIFLIDVKAQVPQAIPYQAVARDVSGDVLMNQTISLRLTAHRDFPTGPISYQETHSVTTNSFGLFVVNFGFGFPLIGNFSDIVWSGGAVIFLEVEMDPAGGTSYINMGNEQLLSVPYALHSKSASSAPGTIAFAIYTDANISTLSDGAAYQFMGPTVSVAIVAGQRVEVTATCGLGTNVATGATLSRIAVCRKTSSDPSPIDNGLDFISGLRMSQNTRLPVTLNTIFTGLATGVYQFGMAYLSGAGQAVNWNSNDWGRVTVKVINP